MYMLQCLHCPPKCNQSWPNWCMLPKLLVDTEGIIYVTLKGEGLPGQVLLNIYYHIERYFTWWAVISMVFEISSVF